MTCPQCRFENPQEARFCTECGAALPAKPSAKNVCAQCGSENEADDAFCTSCGISLKPKPPTEPVKTIVPKAEPKPIAPQAPAIPLPEPLKAAEPKTKPAPSVQETPLPAIQPKPEPRPSPEPKPETVSIPAKAPTEKAEFEAQPQTPSLPAPEKISRPPAPTTATTETRPLPKAATHDRPSLAKRQIVEKPVLVLEKAPPKVEPLIEKIPAQPRQRGKGLLIAGIAAGLVIILLGVWFFALRQKPSRQPELQASAPAETAPPPAPAPALQETAPAMPSAAAPTAPQEEKQKPSEPAPSPTVLPSPAQNKPAVASSRPADAQARPQPAAVSAQVAKGIEAFQQKNYDRCIIEMLSVLVLDPGNKTAQRYLADAQNKKNAAAEVSRFIKAAGDAYQAGDFSQCLEQTQKALSLDPAQAEALRYEEMAHQKLAPQRIKTLVDQFNAAANSGQLLSFYEASCSPSLFQRIKRNVELMNVQYNEFRSQSSQTTIRFLDTGRLEARFSNITTGQLISEGRKMVIFEGAYVWTLERQGDRWLIADLQSQSIRKQRS